MIKLAGCNLITALVVEMAGVTEGDNFYSRPLKDVCNGTVIESMEVPLKVSFVKKKVP